ncbi:hypothetical protein T10_7258 [Trichinella papuae]|uniref:Uncharacterized protein n=1 Tax=Trichinella papuae TaxID=268474 RepID=A0A0V1MTM0_9BILA|nr:hypothetical protein T10_7258 [Trichinella papuae]
MNALLPMCLICEKSSRDKFHAQSTLSTMFSTAAQQKSDEMTAAYNISLLITQTGKPSTTGKKLLSGY